MEEKFSYFDFICYFIPGALLIWAITVFARGFEALAYLRTINEFTDVLGFAIIAFILGHFVQYRAKLKLEPSIKNKYWNRAFVSEQYLVKGKGFSSKIDREKFLKMAKEKLGYNAEELAKLDTDSEESRKISHSIYRKAYALINNEGVAERAATANTYYNFFRGVTVSCLYSAILFLMQFIIKIVRNWWTCSLDIAKKELLIPLLLAAFFFYLKKCFMDRARQRGELHVEQVFNSAYTLCLGGKENAKQS